MNYVKDDMISKNYLWRMIVYTEMLLLVGSIWII